MATTVSTPTIPTHSILGNLPDLRRDPMKFMLQARDYGDVVRLQFPAGPPTFVLSSADVVEEMIVAKSRKYLKPGGSDGVADLIFGQGLLLSNGDHWLRQRRLIQPAFHRQRIAQYGEVMVQYTREMLDKWKSGATFDLHEAMMDLTLRVVVRTLFDVSMPGEVQEVNEAFKVLLDVYTKDLGSLIKVPINFPTPGNIRAHRAAARIDKIIYRIINLRRQSGEYGDDLLSMLLQMEDEDGSRMTDKELRDEVITMFIAGHETSALALTWSWYMLTQYPQYADKLYAEVDRVLAGRDPELADIPNLTYTEWVLNEGLRLYPPAWMSGRVASEDDEIGGYHIPKGAMMLYSEWVLHHDPRYYDNPDRFNPDRWANNFAKTLPRCAYMPFNAGPRICIGNQFAMMEMTLVLATMAQRFHVSLVPGQEVVVQPSFTIRPKYGLKVKVEARQHQ